MKIGYLTTLIILLFLGCVDFGYTLHSLFDSMNQPLEYTKQMVGDNMIIKIIEPSLPWGLVTTSLVIMIGITVIFLYFYLNEQLFPIRIFERRIRQEVDQ